MRQVLVPFIGRGAVMWLLLRLALLATASVAGATEDMPLTPADHLTLEPPTLVLAAAVTVALVFIDIAALRERVFLANIGVDRRQIATVVFLTALTLGILNSILVPVLL